MKIQKLPTRPANAQYHPWYLEQINGIWTCISSSDVRNGSVSRMFCCTENGHTAQHTIMPNDVSNLPVSHLVQEENEGVVFTIVTNRPSLKDALKIPDNLSSTKLNPNTGEESWITLTYDQAKVKVMGMGREDSKQSAYYSRTPGLTVYVARFLSDEQRLALHGSDFGSGNLTVTDRTTTRSIVIPGMDNLKLPRLSQDELTVACLCSLQSLNKYDPDLYLVTVDLDFFHKG